MPIDSWDHLGSNNSASMCDASHWEETIAEQSPKYQLATPPSCQGFGPGLQKTPVRLYVFGLPSSCSSSSSSGVFLWTAAFEARVCGEMSISWPRCLLSPIHAAQWDGGLVPACPIMAEGSQGTKQHFSGRAWSKPGDLGKPKNIKKSNFESCFG